MIIEVKDRRRQYADQLRIMANEIEVGPHNPSGCILVTLHDDMTITLAKIFEPNLNLYLVSGILHDLAVRIGLSVGHKLQTITRHPDDSK